MGGGSKFFSDKFFFTFFIIGYIRNVIPGLRPIFFQAEDGIRDAQESRGLGDVYKRQVYNL